MNEKTYTITLADGSVIGNLNLNGNNFISTTPVDTAIFRDNCSPVVINDGTNDEFHENMGFVRISEVNGEYWFILRDISREELAKIKIQSDIEYIAMMAGVEL